MDERTVRCPFCVQDNDFRRMMPVGDNRFACASCWHVTAPKDNAFQCQCVRCIRLREGVYRPQPPPCIKKGQKSVTRVLDRSVAPEMPAGLAGSSKLA